MPQARPLITLLTDFGSRDHFVASMKGVILSVNPQVTIVDLSHHIAPCAIDEAAHVLRSCYRRFPEGTIHVAVVDPGVGTGRLPLIVRSSRYYFIAPDNGLLFPAVDEEGLVEIRAIENAQYRLESPGRTFDGRDVFAPAGAWLTMQQPFESFGRTVPNPVRLPIEKPVWQGDKLVGKIVSIDRFGNLISNITSNSLAEAAVRAGGAPVSIAAGPVPIRGLVSCYSDGAEDKPYALVNSAGCLEIFLKQQNAAQTLVITVGSPVTVS